jgi:hypothetical protein
MRMGCVGYVARMRSMRSGGEMWPELLRISAERPGHPSGHDIDMDPQKTAGSCNSVDWIHMAQDRDQRRAFVGVVINLSVLQKAGKIVNKLNLQEGPVSSSYSCHDNLYE